MRNYSIGEIVKKLREQRGLTQEDLADLACDTSTISRIENGKIMPKRKTINTLLEKLGYDPGWFDIFYVTNEESVTQKIVNELDSNLAYKRTAEAEADIAKLESCKTFMKNMLNVQYIMCAKALVRKNYKDNIDDVFAAMKEALEITIPRFTLDGISKYFLSKQEMLIINNLAALYMEKEQPNIAIQIMYALKDNFDDNCTNKDYRGKYYPMIINNLSHFLSEAKRYEEVLTVCDTAIELCRDTGYLYSLPHLLFNKAISLYELGDKSECEKLMRIAYTVYDIYGLTVQAKETLEYAKEKYGVILE